MRTPAEPEPLSQSFGRHNPNGFTQGCCLKADRGFKGPGLIGVVS